MGVRIRSKWKSKWIIVSAICAALLAPELIPFLTHHQIAPRTSSSFENRPVNNDLVKAAAAGNLEIVTHDLDAGVSPNAGTGGEGGVSALSTAASAGQLEVAKLLLDRGADVNADDFWGGNAIVSPSLDGDVEMVKLLLARGGDPNMEDDGVTALDYASHQLLLHETKAPLRNYSQIIRLLKMNGGKTMIICDPLVSLGFFLPW